MFYNTWDSWFDDDETRKLKKYRRMSNYYESKYNNLYDSYIEINNLMSDVKNNYGLDKSVIKYVSDDVMRYQYSECEDKMISKIWEVIDYFEEMQDLIGRQRDNAYELYIKYYNLAIGG